MNNNYAHPAEEAKQFLSRVSATTHALTIKFNAYGERAGRITKRENPVEFDAIMTESSRDLDLYAQQMDQLLPDYQRNLHLLTEGFDRRIKSLDAAIDAGELQDMRRAAQGLAETAKEVKPKVSSLREILAIIRDSNHDFRLTRAANNALGAADKLFTAFDDLETFALKVSFSVDET